MSMNFFNLLVQAAVFSALGWFAQLIRLNLKFSSRLSKNFRSYRTVNRDLHGGMEHAKLGVVDG